jgi:hypothetical protein
VLLESFQFLRLLSTAWVVAMIPIRLRAVPSANAMQDSAGQEHHVTHVCQASLNPTLALNLVLTANQANILRQLGPKAAAGVVPILNLTRVALSANARQDSAGQDHHVKRACQASLNPLLAPKLVLTAKQANMMQ